MDPDEEVHLTNGWGVQQIILSFLLLLFFLCNKALSDKVVVLSLETCIHIISKVQSKSLRYCK